ncbi:MULTISPECIES: M48 family metallopeptidase [Bacillaceae]|uniref:M48 family metallopeptidase n=1 Tax=Bacillaceae TaxID=186817 RepID=UPI000BFC2121|nr:MULTISPECIES: SprT family zinc-dependent metalloprotease [Bacillaceae]PGT82449.1 zinc protease [Bacillus sp. AFS040349]UGB31306.1 M48 family metallopeptidase [Metabacillus sp. B2-18]
MKHTYLGRTIHFEIRYKNRASVGISIDRYGNIEVLAPKRTLDETVFQALEDKWDLIQDKVKEMHDRLKGPQDKVYQNGESFLYLGETYPIEIIQDNKSLSQDSVVFDNGKLLIYVQQHDAEKNKVVLKRFYYQQCKQLVEQSVSYYQRYFKTKPRSIRITDSKTTWGTCDSKHQLTFNWRLAMAPREVIDYVVVHEMCHMVHLNHDRSFWRLVGKIVPDFKEKERWLALTNWKMTV